MKGIKPLVICVILIIIAGCQTPGIIISEVKYSFSLIKSTVIECLPRGLSRQSQNGRVLYSNYYDPKSVSGLYMPESIRFRAYAKVTILNSSRPYDLNVVVIYEKRDPQDKGQWEKFQVIGPHDGESKKIAELIRKKLDERTKDRNLIDDFRAF